MQPSASTTLPRTSAVPAFYAPRDYDPDESIGYLMKRVLGSIEQQADRGLRRQHVTHTQWRPLFLLRNQPMAVLELARRLSMDAGAMTRLLDRLEKKGFCRRVRANRDRRIVRVSLTALGEAAAAHVPTVLSDVLNAHLAGFSRTEWRALVGLLRRMLENGAVARSRGLPMRRLSSDEESSR